jgi:hypothetical protein
MGRGHDSLSSSYKTKQKHDSIQICRAPRENAAVPLCDPTPDCGAWLKLTARKTDGYPNIAVKRKNTANSRPTRFYMQ